MAYRHVANRVGAIHTGRECPIIYQLQRVYYPWRFAGMHSRIPTAVKHRSCKVPW